MNSDPLSLYLHIPFCSLKCAYCDFNSYAGLDDLIRPYDDALVEEIRLWGHVAQGPSPEPAPIGTVFFGGGTPSLLPLPEIERVMSALRESFALQPDAEISLEANPGTIDLGYLRGLVDAGVNRLSFGVQSFHDDELMALDRIHTAEEAVEGYRWAREAGFQRINLDFIYGLAGQSFERWQSTLERAIALEPDHLSLYALTVEEGTKLAYDVGQGTVPEPDPDLQAEMYEWAMERLDGAGYRQYEISNWARPGQECRHNLVYWRNGEWLGLGAGAHSNWAGHRFANVYSPRQYLERMAKAHGVDLTLPVAGILKAMPQISLVEQQSGETAMADTAILGLRLNEGLDARAFERRFGASLDAAYGSAITELGSLGLLERSDGNLRLTPRGRLLANEVFVRLLPD
ncbi:MAG TPA: radical SAM family heme chaperone HemW [Dehalococcoidia bacterium]|nr:radical SAM family heme chaperone HemW [Dehalococcoidia bacterium]